jgi:TolB-like protein/class 3 adenylate cyclase
MERKLSTIFASDVVGFSKMMAANEEQTLDLLKQRRLVIDGLIAEHSGTIFGSAGDSVIAEFASPIKATECAVQMQGKMQAMNEDVPEERKMVFRVGINIGDVMVSQDNLYGDAVNIAARLEGQAKPDGICISKSVLDMVSQKLQVSYEDAGELALKNIAHPVQAYFVIQKRGATRYVQHADAPQLKVERIESGSLAVMLFKNLSKDEEQAYFCEGFSEDLISALSRFRKLTVLSGNASFAYRDRSSSPKEIGQELGVRYILEGSVRKLGPRMRVSASLISAEREHTVWSNNFDTTIDEIFDIQDELVETIVSTIVGRVEADALQELTSNRPENLAAYDVVLQGLEYHRRSMTAGENARKAYELFNKAIEIDPNYARAHAWSACSLANTAGWYPQDFDDSWFDDCTASVTRALEIDPNDPEAHRIMGAIKLSGGDFELATYHHERAVELCPSDAYIRSRYASLLIYLGEPQQALDEIHRAMRVDPFCPDVLFEDEGMGYYWLENYGNAIKSLRKVKVPTRNSLFYLAAALAKAEQTETASDTLKQAITTMDMTVEGFVSSQGYKNQEKRDELLQTLEPIAV